MLFAGNNSDGTANLGGLFLLDYGKTGTCLTVFFLEGLGSTFQPAQF